MLASDDAVTKENTVATRSKPVVKALGFAPSLAFAMFRRLSSPCQSSVTSEGTTDENECSCFFLTEFKLFSSSQYSDLETVSTVFEGEAGGFGTEVFKLIGW